MYPDHENRRFKRCYQRVMAGIEKWGTGKLRFLTLTSSPSSPADIGRSWTKLQLRLRRRGLLKAYIKVLEHTSSGLVHLHVLFEGSFIDQVYLSALWKEIHQAEIVDIRKAYGRKGVARYLGKYMSKAGEHYSCSWGWCHLGMVRVWTWFKSFGRYPSKRDFSVILDAWCAHVRRVRLLESFCGVRPGGVRVLTEACGLLYIADDRCVWSENVPFVM